MTWRPELLPFGGQYPSIVDAIAHTRQAEALKEKSLNGYNGRSKGSASAFCNVRFFKEIGAGELVGQTGWARAAPESRR